LTLAMLVGIALGNSITVRMGKSKNKDKEKADVEQICGGKVGLSRAVSWNAHWLLVIY